MTNAEVITAFVNMIIEGFEALFAFQVFGIPVVAFVILPFVVGLFVSLWRKN